MSFRARFLMSVVLLVPLMIIGYEFEIMRYHAFEHMLGHHISFLYYLLMFSR
jgi:hypothetical protein